MVMFGFVQQPLWKPVVTANKRRDKSFCARGHPHRKLENAEVAATGNWLCTEELID